MKHTAANSRTEDLETVQAEARAWARRLRLDSPTTEDAAAFKRWRAQSPAHAHAWAEASSDWRDLGPVAQAFQARHPAPSGPARRAPQRAGRRLFLGSALAAGGAAAAAAVVVNPPLGLWPSWSELGADYRTATGEQRDIELPDRTQLALNTQTSLAVRPASDAEGGITRIEVLAGEAAVQNHRAAPLEVRAGAGRIRLGAGSIEVRCLAVPGAWGGRGGDRVRLLCTEGEAELHHPLGVVALAVGQQLFYSHGDVGRPMGVDPAQASAWREGVVVFRDTPLPEAVAEINRYRPGRVVLLNDALAARRISGRFRIGALDEAIVQIRQLYDTGVRTIGGVVLLG